MRGIHPSFLRLKNAYSNYNFRLREKRSRLRHFIKINIKFQN